MLNVNVCGVVIGGGVVGGVVDASARAFTADVCSGESGRALLVPCVPPCVQGVVVAECALVTLSRRGVDAVDGASTSAGGGGCSPAMTVRRRRRRRRLVGRSLVESTGTSTKTAGRLTTGRIRSRVGMT